MPNFKQTTDQYIADLKTLAAGDPDKLQDLCLKAANRLGARAQKLQLNKTQDLAKFIGELPGGDPAHKATFDSWRATKQAERDAAGDTEE